jgi:Flp pilus assembly protein TadG
MLDRMIRCDRTAQRGVAAVEFALMLPLVLLLTFGAITFTVALYSKAILTYASRQAVRAWVVTKPILTKDSVQQIASGHCQSQMISFGTGVVSCVPVAVGSDVPAPGDVLTVSVSLNFTGLYVFKDLVITSQTSMKFE